ncbi:Flp pilus assembly complex ATPase component TadA [Candidatus Woesearchaeota archaeon]|nr:Flp pilus assembly complex ATPase component TadA [Candidatus Woesearchaeota archaeon]
MAEETKTIFQIDTRPEIVQLPDIRERSSINIRYPLLKPYAYAHIFWDEKESELVYFVEEPKLLPAEREILRLIQLALEEMINISYTHASKMNLVIQYLERNVQAILVELGTKVSRETYLKLMYYLFRDSVGLNRIEPLLHDYYIEDIECNGLNFPLYVVHRKFENMRTNILYRNPQELSDFVEKLAQKCGRYVSYAKPLLDGTLPDGSRVNATYTEDITTRGPTFTIRKFTKDPWTPIHLINFGTAPAIVFAYIWLVIENKSNIMVVGETASGKTTFLNSILSFIPPDARICSIEDTRELNLAHENWMPSVTRTGFGIPNLIGREYGEVTLFDLLKESFRQNPDYVIVGEVRGKEAFVLFQGMASGHSSFGTFHAGSVETLVRRLETPPINLSPSLIESLDIVCVMTHLKEVDKNIRRIKQLVEVQSVEREIGQVNKNIAFTWNPVNDTIDQSGELTMIQKISQKTGASVEELTNEIETRARLLEIMAEQKIEGFKSVNEIIKSYYVKRDLVLKKFNLL